MNIPSYGEFDNCHLSHQNNNSNRCQLSYLPDIRHNSSLVRTIYRQIFACRAFPGTSDFSAKSFQPTIYANWNSNTIWIVFMCIGRSLARNDMTFIMCEFEFAVFFFLRFVFIILFHLKSLTKFYFWLCMLTTQRRFVNRVIVCVSTVFCFSSFGKNECIIRLYANSITRNKRKYKWFKIKIDIYKVCAYEFCVCFFFFKWTQYNTNEEKKKYKPSRSFFSIMNFRCKSWIEWREEKKTTNSNSKLTHTHINLWSGHELDLDELIVANVTHLPMKFGVNAHYVHLWLCNTFALGSAYWIDIFFSRWIHIRIRIWFT